MDLDFNPKLCLFSFQMLKRGFALDPPLRNNGKIHLLASKQYKKHRFFNFNKQLFQKEIVFRFQIAEG